MVRAVGWLPTVLTRYEVRTLIEWPGGNFVQVILSRDHDTGVVTIPDLAFDEEGP